MGHRLGGCLYVLSNFLSACNRKKMCDHYRKILLFHQQELNSFNCNLRSFILKPIYWSINQLHLLLQQKPSSELIIKNSPLPSTFCIISAPLLTYYSKSHPSETRHHDYMASNLPASITGFLCCKSEKDRECEREKERDVPLVYGA